MGEVDEWLEKAYNCEVLPEQVVKTICTKLKEILVKEANILNLQTPVTVVGDVHGQFYDVMELFRVAGKAPDVNFLFLGDYVDRGYFSVETMVLLALLKLRYPNRVNIIRGNHESRQITQVYGFYNECMRKYGSGKVWSYFTELFDFIALGAIIDDRYFCVHGGLSPLIQSTKQIVVIHRFQEVPHEGAMSDLLWSDPDPNKMGFGQSQRGAGYTFGEDAVKKFSKVNSFEHILRAHQLCNEGYQVLFNDRLSTIWSAPNYCYRCKNKASVMEIDEKRERTFNVFDSTPASERLPEPDSNRIVKVEYFL